MSRVKSLPVVEVSGKPYDMGKAAGKKCSAKGQFCRKAMAEAIAHETRMDWPKAVSRAKEYLPYAEDFYPDFIEELRGYAAGAGMSFEDVFTMCCHELLSTSGFKGCTDVACSGEVTSDGHVLIGHNEDWSPDVQDVAVLIHAKPKGKPAFLATSYAGIVHSTGMNSSGISLTGNALRHKGVRLGIPKLFPVRKALEARTIGEALADAMPEGRASSYNNICSDSNGEIYSLEGSATDYAALYALDGYLVHTNHFVSERMRPFEAYPDDISCSMVRYFRALKLVERQLGEVSIDSMISIFKDHVSRPGSICRHATPGVNPLDVSETIFSVVYDLTSRTAHVCKGKPCSSQYVTVALGK